MKEKIKQIILYLLVTYTITITIMIIINISTSTKYIHLSDSEDNLTKRSELKQELTKLDQNDCTSSIIDLIDLYNNTSYNGYISLREYYNQESFLSYYEETKKICQITNSEYQNYNFAHTILIQMIAKENLFQNYMYQYELNLKDILMHENNKDIIHYYEYKFIIKQSELSIITNLIELIKERNKTHE